MNSKTFLAILLMANLWGFSSFSWAEKYVEVHRDELGGNVYSVDVDSFKPSSFKEGILLRYRSRSGSTTLQYSAVGFCNDLSMWTLKVEGVAPTYTFPVKEYYKEPVGWVEDPQVIAPLFTQGWGKVLARACETAKPEELDLLIAPPTQETCFNTKDEFTKAICDSGGDARGNVSLLKTRSERVAAACGQEVFMKSELQTRMVRVAQCGGREMCNRYAMGDMMGAISRDFGALIQWEARGRPQPFPVADVCKSEAALRLVAYENQQKNENDSARKNARDSLQRCVITAVTKLDDKVTDAKLVADAAVKSCSKETNQLASIYVRIDSKQDWRPAVDSVRDDAIPTILENRAKARKR